jgi:hypothetical protein
VLYQHAELDIDGRFVLDQHAELDSDGRFVLDQQAELDTLCSIFSFLCSYL